MFLTRLTDDYYKTHPSLCVHKLNKYTFYNRQSSKEQIAKHAYITILIATYLQALTKRANCTIQKLISLFIYKEFPVIIIITYSFYVCIVLTVINKVSAVKYCPK